MLRVEGGGLSLEGDGERGGLGAGGWRVDGAFKINKDLDSQWSVCQLQKHLDWAPSNSKSSYARPRGTAAIQRLVSFSGRYVCPGFGSSPSSDD